LNSD